MMTNFWLRMAFSLLLSAAVIGVVVRMLGDAPGADHLDVVVHQAARAGGIAHLDEREQLAVHVEHRRATCGVGVLFSEGHETCCSEISCVTSTRLCEASATAR